MPRVLGTPRRGEVLVKSRNEPCCLRQVLEVMAGTPPSPTQALCALRVESTTSLVRFHPRTLLSHVVGAKGEDPVELSRQVLENTTRVFFPNQKQ